VICVNAITAQIGANWRQVCHITYYNYLHIIFIMY